MFHSNLLGHASLNWKQKRGVSALRKAEIEDEEKQIESSLLKAKNQRDGISKEFGELTVQEERERIAKMKKGKSIASKKRRLDQDPEFSDGGADEDSNDEDGRLLGRLLNIVKRARRGLYSFWFALFFVSVFHFFVAEPATLSAIPRQALSAHSVPPAAPFLTLFQQSHVRLLVLFLYLI